MRVFAWYLAAIVPQDSHEPQGPTAIGWRHEGLDIATSMKPRKEKLIDKAL